MLILSFIFTVRRKLCVSNHTVLASITPPFLKECCDVVALGHKIITLCHSFPSNLWVFSLSFFQLEYSNVIIYIWSFPSVYCPSSHLFFLFSLYHKSFLHVFLYVLIYNKLDLYLHISLFLDLLRNVANGIWNKILSLSIFLRVLDKFRLSQFFFFFCVGCFLLNKFDIAQLLSLFPDWV
jgi:hypothetical protein